MPKLQSFRLKLLPAPPLARGFRGQGKYSSWAFLQEFGMHKRCKALHMDRTTLFRKLKALTGRSTTVFIRSLRLEKAKELL